MFDRNAAQPSDATPGRRHDRIARMREKLSHRPAAAQPESAPPAPEADGFGALADVKKIQIHKAVAREWGIDTRYFLPHDGLARDVTVIGGKTYLNFSTYDYLGLNGHPEVEAAALAAMRRFGTSSSGSRPTSGERPPHRELETALADLYGTEACIAFVSGHATNVWTIAQLFKKRDLVIHDSLAHNSILQGGQISQATRLSFPHNDLEALDALLAAERGRFKRVLIATEGLFSMDGDVPDLPRLLDIKKRHHCFLMIDEAHALGVLGSTGRGVAEHFGVDSREVDIWMGTLSKALCGCGGYIAGPADMVECLKYLAPGFLYSVGMSPPLAAASRAALAVMLREPGRVAALADISRYFLEYAASLGLDTGKAQGHAIVPVMIGSSIEAAMLASRLFTRGVYVMPIIFPVVEECAARLRFFLSSLHSREQVRQALDLVAEELPRVRGQVAALAEAGGRQDLPDD
jgi:8-amino-7-oxononanoate synthase